MSQWDVSIRVFPTYIYRENLRKLPYKEVDVTHAWNEYLRLAQSAHVTNNAHFLRDTNWEKIEQNKLGTKHSRKDKSRSKKTKTVCQENGEGQTYGAGMLWLGEDCEVRRCAHKARSDFVSFCTNLHADYGYCFQVDFS